MTQILTNNVKRPVQYRDKADSGRFTYNGCTYELADMIYVSNRPGWDAAISLGMSYGLVVKTTDFWETVVVGRYFVPSTVHDHEGGSTNSSSIWKKRK